MGLSRDVELKRRLYQLGMGSESLVASYNFRSYSRSKFAGKDGISQLLFLPACCHASSTMVDTPSGTLDNLKSFFHNLFLVSVFVTAAERKLEHLV